ncbi:MAG TPA: glycosyltransferase [Candidatus Aminicenantes bacterium]|nr:glycosyltransferase [Candidatus Aminicenantes bacterium]HRY64462.1 glycosyltransferase [Candidatus Aminicenantes bacterium]HRZ71375.1 glycosyltransferase [Candidatus Aminicenantes bacterium]
MAPRIAFVVATKDRPDELRRLWASLLAQSRPPDEVVIVDASARPSPLPETGGGRPVLRFVRSAVASASRQRNLGLDAVGPDVDLVGFLDDDAVLEPGAIEAMLGFWSQAGPEVAGAAFNMANHPPLALPRLKRTPLVESLGLYARRGGAVTASGFQTMIGTVSSDAWTDWLPSGASVWRRAVFARQRFDEWFAGYSYLEDLDFSYRAGKTGRLAVVAAARYRHLPAAGGRGGGFEFGLREVLNRVHFVRKDPDLSLARCRAALAARMLMSVAAGIGKGEPDHLLRAGGNAVGLVRSFLEPGLAGRGDPAAIVVYGQVPPPYIGSNVMTRQFLEALRAGGYQAVLSRKSLSGDVADVNRIRPAKAFRLLATWGRFASRLRRARPDLAVIFSSSTYVGLAAESVVVGLCRLYRVPYVLYLHTDVHRRLAAAPFPLRPVLLAAFRSAAACFVLGRVFRDEMAAERPGRVFVLPNCVADPAGPDGAARPGGQARILFLSNIEESKGVMTLLRAALLVLAEAPGVTFSIAGPWRDRAIRREVEGFLAAHGLGRSVVLAGEAYGEAKTRIMAEHDIFVLPSRREAMSLAVLEAMRAGLPVVTTGVGAMAEAVEDGVTGFLVPPDDPAALARRLLELARDAELRSAMGRAGRSRYEREFTPAAYERRVCDILARLLAGEAAS